MGVSETMGKSDTDGTGMAIDVPDCSSGLTKRFDRWESQRIWMSVLVIDVRWQER